ncbi:MAG: hypothetical protein JEZ06_10115 [Anaerolineaceae bacterium]|nr:hypothetical protein [Anaerolineaceae bacterium]
MEEMINCPMCGKPNQPGEKSCAFCEARLIPLLGSNEGQEDKWVHSSVELPEEGLSFDHLHESERKDSDKKIESLQGIPSIENEILLPGFDVHGVQENLLPNWLQNGDSKDEEKMGEERKEESQTEDLSSMDWLGVLRDGESGGVEISSQIEEIIPGSSSWFEENPPEKSLVSNLEERIYGEEDPLLDWVSSLEEDNEAGKEIDKKSVSDETDSDEPLTVFSPVPTDSPEESLVDPTAWQGTSSFDSSRESFSQKESELPPWMRDSSPYENPDIPEIPEEKHDFTKDFMLPLDDEIPKNETSSSFPEMDLKFETIEPGEDIPEPIESVEQEKSLFTEEEAHLSPSEDHSVDLETMLSEMPEWMRESEDKENILQLESESIPEIIQEHIEDVSGTIKNELNLVDENQDQVQNEEITGKSFLTDEMAEWIKNLPDEEVFPEQDDKTEGSDLSENDVIIPEEISKPKFVDQELPDWLDEESVIESAEPEETESPHSMPLDEESLQPGMMPTWLAAMRPVDAVIPESSTLEENAEAEISGPLAGLFSIIPGEGLVTQYKKPPVYSIRLQVSENQRREAALLEKIVADERKIPDIDSKKARSKHGFLRMLVGLVLIAALLLPLIGTPVGSMVTDLKLSSIGQDFYEVLESIPQDGKVLLAFEFDPGFYGEMSLTASGVMERLLQKEEQFVLISTVPTGPVMGKNLLLKGMEQVAPESPEVQVKYASENIVVNLGYLAGGATSLKEFAISPRKAARLGMGVNVANQTVWNHPVIQNVNKISDFSAVIVFTDKIETGKAWVEQVKPEMGSTPLLFVSSAQAAPMFLPYLQSQQIQGMMSGLGDGVAYAQLMDLPGERAGYWSAFRNGLMVILSLILIGAISQGISGLFRTRNKNEA